MKISAVLLLAVALSRMYTSMAIAHERLRELTGCSTTSHACQAVPAASLARAAGSAMASSATANFDHVHILTQQASLHEPVNRLLEDCCIER